MRHEEKVRGDVGHKTGSEDNRSCKWEGLVLGLGMERFLRPLQEGWRGEERQCRAMK